MAARSSTRKRLGVVHAEPGDGLGSAMALLAERGDGAQVMTLRTAEHAIDDFALDEQAEERDVAGRVEKIDEARAGVEHFDGRDSDGHADGVSGFGRRREFFLTENAADVGYVELQVEAEHRLLGRGRDDLANDGEIEGREKKRRPVAEIGLCAEIDPLLPLDKDDETGIIGGRSAVGGGGGAIEVELRDAGSQKSVSGNTFDNFLKQIGACRIEKRGLVVSCKSMAGQGDLRLAL